MARMIRFAELIAAVLFTVLAVGLILLLGALLRPETETAGALEQSAYAAAAADDGASAAYWLREYHGNVAVFAGAAEGKPMVETDISVSGLRQYDQALLKKGMRVYSYEAVLALLEDLGS